MIKITIRKGPVSLELEVPESITIQSIKEIIYENIPIPPSLQSLSVQISAVKTKLDPSQNLESLNIVPPYVFYLEELKSPIESTFSISSTISSDSEYSLAPWVIRAVKYCKESTYEKLIRLKEEFNLTTIAQLKGHSFGEIINTPTENKWNCVHIACKSGHSGILQELLTVGGECNTETADEWTPLQLVSFHGYLLCAEILLNQPTIQINKSTKLRGTALHMACAGGHLKLVKTLLDSQASPYLENAEGMIPLQLATKTSIIELIPKYIGQEFLNKYARGNELQKPQNYSGELFWSASWQINDKLVLLLLDVDSGNILQYNKKVNFLQGLPPDQQIPICEVKDIVNSEESSIENKYFIHIRARDETFKYYSKNIDVASNWVQKLVSALRYYQENASPALAETYRMSRMYSVMDFDDLNFEEFAEEENLTEPVSFASFEIIEEIGVGSFGKVFKVIKKDTGKRYALKAINKIELKRNQQYKYVIAECKILKSIKHPFIIPLYWAFQTPNNVYMVFELCPFGDLSKVLSEKQTLPESAVRVYMAEILLALEFLHSIDVIYRDLKPQNILIDEDCHAKLADFGLARENSNKNNPATTFCGSPGYLAPEIINNTGVFKPADIYSFGICLYEILAGRLPFQESNVLKLYKQITTGKINFPNSIGNHARSLITAITCKAPEKRLTINEIKNHPFFEEIDWKKTSNKEIDPPIFFNERATEKSFADFVDKDYSRISDQLLTSQVR